MPEALINGHKHYWEDRGAGDPILMFHGAAGSGLSLAGLGTELAKTHRTLAVDMRSMGRSAHVAEIPPSAWVDDAVALLAHLGIARAHIFGVSLGARVALRLVADHPQLVRSLILEQPIIAMEGDTNQALNNNIGSFDNFSEAEQKQRQAIHGDDWRTVMANYFAIRNRPELQAHYSLREQSKAVAVPTLILRGDEREPVHPLAHCFELHQNIAGSWLWIRPNSKSNLSRTVPDEAFEKIRALLASAP